MTLRERDCAPVPHDLVHVVHALKLDTTQCEAQACVLHARVSPECGQATPPFTGCATVRERDCEPLPHDLVHVVHALKLATWQLTGHACALQRRVSAACGHALPPYLGCVCVRERDCAPVPQDLVHDVHAPNAPCWQSAAQACVLQSRVSARYGQT